MKKNSQFQNHGRKPDLLDPARFGKKGYKNDGYCYDYTDEYMYSVRNTSYGVHIEVSKFVIYSPEKIKILTENFGFVPGRALAYVADWYMNDLEAKPNGRRPTVKNAMELWYKEQVKK